MTIASVFSQLNQAYLLISLSDWSRLIANKSACRMLRLNADTLEQGALWNHTLKPLLSERYLYHPVARRIALTLPVL
ncbi:hypothetical protein QKW35_02685 [Pontibacterium granulatum]|uniref:hypothetical protein n=1 Tax=Pontibacterium granulatum TaxID=2036029 RepID=UPI00249AA4FE|nr:hypothetical protein [Pontibacterium granulatum]MDI3323271.1 hypothetical protein [Pontibacterium granulatum]